MLNLVEVNEKDTSTIKNTKSQYRKSRRKTKAQRKALSHGAESSKVTHKHKRQHQFTMPKVEKYDTSTTKTTSSCCGKLRSKTQAQPTSLFHGAKNWEGTSKAKSTESQCRKLRSKTPWEPTQIVYSVDSWEVRHETISSGCIKWFVFRFDTYW